ncbi:hypothetical protein GCK32_005755 [Trichostrongylus colubriformis]|uniref:Uncharacterized protein n=1 Tax=Trichostrongylus colubriformis TaxID=6319 RepID=A0AAN8FV14_TRICO
MVRVCRVVPKEWTRYSPLGGVIPRTRFIVFKTPLNDRLLTRVDPSQRFAVSNLMWMLAERGLRLGMVVDLTDTDRYYDKDEIEGMCIQYQKINCPGRGFVERTECVAEFNKAIQDYIDSSDDEEALIGVHCTNGVNRSGYLICRFLIERLGWSSHEALDAFERARGYPIEKGSYVQALHKAAIQSRNRRDVSDSESEERRRKVKKSKRKRERDELSNFTDSASQMGNIMQQFFAQLQGAHQAAESGNGSGYEGSPAQSGSYVASPAQQHWAYQTKAQNMNPSYSESPADQSMQDEEMEEGEMGLPVMPFDLQQQRKQYRAPFKVQFVKWNPCSDLLALASRKGEVMVKRNMWKRCWKLNLSEVTAFPETQCTKPACVESMTWSPDGAILAVAMSDGHLHLIEAEQERFNLVETLQIPGRDGTGFRLGQNTCAQQMRWFWSGEPPAAKSRLRQDWPLDETKAVASIFGNGDLVDERLGKSLLYENLYLKSLRFTILFMVSHLKLDVINVYDVLYTPRDGLTLAVTDYGPRPKLDDVDRDKFGSPSFVADAINCPHTHLINIDFKLENEDLLWELLLRFVQIFANRLNSTPHDLRLADALLNSLLGGAPGPLAERWLERTLGAAGIQSMREFVEKRFSGLVAMLRGQLSAAARSLAFQMDQYRELIRELQDANTDYERELSQLVRWMSLLTPLLKNTKRSAQVVEQNSKWDVANLLKYIVQTFTTDNDERELLSLSLFKIEEVLKELRAEETKEHFSHDELIRVLVEEGTLKRTDDDRTLSELLSSARKAVWLLN